MCMRCPMCGAELPEGARVCDMCGARASFGAPNREANIRMDFSEAPEEAESRREREKTAVGPLGSLIRIRIAAIILSILAIIVGFALMGKINSNSTLSDMENFLVYARIYSIVVGVTGLILSVLSYLVLHDMVRAEPLFDKVCTFLIIQMVLEAVEFFWDASIVSLAKSVISILFSYNYCMALRDLCLPDCSREADQWSLCWKLMVAEMIAAFVVGVAAVFRLTNLQTISDVGPALRSYQFLLVIVYVLALVMTIVELVFLNNTKKALSKF